VENGRERERKGKYSFAVLLAGSTSTMVEHLTIEHEIKGFNPARHPSAPVDNGREREKENKVLQYYLLTVLAQW
jgi:hypothetical protein